jgi:cytochrome c556
MRLHATILLATAVLVGGTALAQEKAQNATVQARKDLMQVVRTNTGVLGDMAQGKTAFDAAAAAAAKAGLAAAAAEIPARFEANEGDPVSKAKPEIWTNWADFVAKGEALLAGAEALDASSLDGVKAGMGAIGGSCQSCHTAYRL